MARAVIWYADLRDAAALTTTAAPEAVAAMRRDLFDAQIEALERHGAQRVAITGEGLLATVALDAERTAAEVARATLLAADETLVDTAALDTHRTATGRPPLRLGLALHVGELARGDAPLDLASLDPATGLVVRLQVLTSRIGVPLVASEAFAALVPDTMRPLGIFRLRGVAAPTTVYVRR
jgi:adenylate cyclase